MRVSQSVSPSLSEQYDVFREEDGPYRTRPFWGCVTSVPFPMFPYKVRQNEVAPWDETEVVPITGRCEPVIGLHLLDLQTQVGVIDVLQSVGAILSARRVRSCIA